VVIKEQEKETAGKKRVPQEATGQRSCGCWIRLCRVLAFLCFARMTGKVLFPRWTLDPRAGKYLIGELREWEERFSEDSREGASLGGTCSELRLDPDAPAERCKMKIHDCLKRLRALSHCRADRSPYTC
jgi:hypothetical protein